MIKNEREYQVAKQKLEMLAESLAQAQKHSRPAQPEAVRQAGLNGIRFLLDDLEAEIAEYEKLRADAASTASAPTSS